MKYQITKGDCLVVSCDCDEVVGVVGEGEGEGLAPSV